MALDVLVSCFLSDVSASESVSSSSFDSMYRGSSPLSSSSIDSSSLTNVGVIFLGLNFMLDPDAAGACNLTKI